MHTSISPDMGSVMEVATVKLLVLVVALAACADVPISADAGRADAGLSCEWTKCGEPPAENLGSLHVTHANGTACMPESDYERVQRYWDLSYSWSSCRTYNDQFANCPAETSAP